MGAVRDTRWQQMEEGWRWWREESSHATSGAAYSKNFLSSYRMRSSISYPNHDSEGIRSRNQTNQANTNTNTNTNTSPDTNILVNLSNQPMNPHLGRLTNQIDQIDQNVPRSETFGQEKKGKP